MAFEQKPEVVRSLSMGIWGNDILGRGSRTYKGPEWGRERRHVPASPKNDEEMAGMWDG